VVQQVIEDDSADLPKIAQGGAPKDSGSLEEEFSRCASWAIECVLSNLYPEVKLPKSESSRLS
jgi:hypothetical protein